jgi:iron complex transport system substrate-binding protein
MPALPRLACLSAESADLCARLGAWPQVVAVTAYADQAGLDPRPIVSGFSKGDVDRILAHSPDLVLAFSDVQASLCADLVRAGATVFATNQRTLAETAAAMRAIARLIGHADAGDRLVAEFEQSLTDLRRVRPRPPRVYFEEWPDPPVTGIAWVGELIELAGGCDVFADRRHRFARERTVTDPDILAAAPEVILASWCGKPFDRASLEARLAGTPAVRAGRVFELPGAVILQPGWRLLEGARRLREILDTIE